MRRNLFYIVLVAISLVPIATIGSVLYLARGEIKFSDLSVQVTASFCGAFFAYLFLWTAGHLDKRAEREVRGINALVKMQHITNDALVRMGNNKNDLTGFMAWAANCIKEQNLHKVYKMHLQNIPTPADLLNDLTNLEFVNQLYPRVVDIEAINADTEKISALIPEQILLLIDGKIQLPDFLRTLKFSSEQAGIMLIALNEAENGCIETMATARILSKQRSWLLHLRNDSFLRELSAKDLMEIDEEKLKLKAEIADSRAKSAAKIDKLFGARK